MVFELVYCKVPPPNEMVPDVPIAFAEPKLKTPALMLVPPVYVLLPLRVKVPEPDLVTATDVAEPFSIRPVNEDDVLSAPIVIVSVPDTELVIVPAPEREPND